MEGGRGVTRNTRGDIFLGQCPWRVRGRLEILEGTYFPRTECPRGTICPGPSVRGGGGTL